MTDQATTSPVQKLPVARPHPGFSPRRVGAMLLRHLYILRGSWPRLIELAYWPTMQMLIWGFMTTFLAENSTWVAQAGGVLISAVLLWDVLFRANLGMSLTFIEEMWARNLAQLFVSPLRPSELMVTLMIMAAIRTLISVAPAAFMALPLFGYWVFDLGPPLAAFFANLLIMGWWIGLFVAGIVLRFGLGAESVCWLGVFLFAPISGIWYPIAVLPDWLELVALALPGAHVFEGMRAVLLESRFDWDHLGAAVGLNAVYLAAAVGFFLYQLKRARNLGLLLQQGE
ncbi:MAG: ABC transporter permease [Rhodospirillales bacterium]